MSDVPKSSTPHVESVAQSVVDLLQRAADAYLKSIGTDGAEIAKIEIELQVPRNAEHGDWATNLALKLAKPLKAKPIEIAKGIVGYIEANNLIEPPDVVAPGFINLRVGAEAIRRTIGTILTEKENFGRS